MHFTAPQDGRPGRGLRLDPPVGLRRHLERHSHGRTGLVTWKDIHTGLARLDMLMDKYAGKKIVYVIAATPQWAASDPNAPHAAPWLGAGSNSLPGDLDAS